MWEVTVLHGKTALRVAFPPPTTDAQWIETLQQSIATQTGVAVAHQKLLYRGKQLTCARGPELTNHAKLMLLKNASFHQQHESSTPPMAEASEEEKSAPIEKPTPRVVAVSQRLGIDPSDIDEDHVLVQAARGKAVFEFLFLATAPIASVKTRIGGALGLSGDALRILLKGKTPPNDAPLSNFVGAGDRNRVVKCMVLLQAKQHDLMEREEEFRSLQNDLTQVDADLQRLANAMQRNVLTQDEVLVRLHASHDAVERLESNLEILEEQLKETKLAQGSATIKALVNAKSECNELKCRVEKLTRQFESGR